MYTENNDYRQKTRKFYRSRNKVLGGVCGGIAEYCGLNPPTVRLIAIITLFCGSLGFWAYIILWIATPLEPYNLR